MSHSTASARLVDVAMEAFALLGVLNDVVFIAFLLHISRRLDSLYVDVMLCWHLHQVVLFTITLHIIHLSCSQKKT